MSIEAKLFELFVKEGSLTPAQIEKVVGKAKYVSKYVLYLRLAGHEIVTHKSGRTVDKFTYTGVSNKVTKKPTERRASDLKNPAPVSKPVVSKPAAAVQVPSKAKTPKAPQKPKLKKDEVESTFGTSGAVSSSVDADWDKVDISDFRSMAER
jgi:hypothetical protein